MRRLVPLLVLLCVAAGGYAAWHWWTEARFLEATDNAYVEGEISVVSPKVAGYVRELPAADNLLVAAGDVLAVIDDAEYRSRLASAQAEVEAALAAIGSTDSRIVLEHSLIAEKEAAVLGAQADLKRAQREYERVTSLMRDDIATRQRHDAAQADLSMMEAGLAKARASLAAGHDQLGVLQAERREAEARAAEARARLDIARIEREDTVIRSPVAGVVGNRGVRLGQYVRAGTPLLSVVPLPDVHVVANFKETQLARMRPGQTALIHVDAFPDQPIRGTVESFAPASGSRFSLLPPENATGNFTKVVQRVPVRIALDAGNPLAGLLRPGLSVEASIDTRSGPEGPLVAGTVFGALARAGAGQGDGAVQTAEKLAPHSAD
jgi:membrane fusion protein, multidrug efflux system